jgi:hypothetical protein
MKKAWKIIGLALVLGMLVALYPMSSALASGSVNPLSDTLSISIGNAYAISVAPEHTIAFTTATSIPVGGKIQITFASGFNIASIVDADVVEALTGGATATWSVSGQTLTGTIATNAVTASAQQVVIGDGAAGGKNDITNPSNAGTYSINVVTRNASGVQLDSGYCLVQIGMSMTASVTVKTYISATITDYGDAGINFGNMDPGVTNSPELAQTGSNGAVNVTMGSENNVSVYVSTEAAGDWSDGNGHTFSVSQGTFNSVNTPPGTNMSTSYQQVGGAVSAGASVQVYHWLSIPNNQVAGLYTNTYYYKVDIS